MRKTGTRIVKYGCFEFVCGLYIQVRETVYLHKILLVRTHCGSAEMPEGKKRRENATQWYPRCDV
jgi:hypothetical protein